MENSNIKISIIITTYNSDSFIKKAIESVLTQTHQNFECIVIDDGSSDNTKAEVSPYLKDERVSYVYQQNVGISATRNNGISLAKGDYLLFLDVDDMIPNNAMADLLTLALKNPKADFIFGKSGETKGQNSAVYKTQRHDLPKNISIKNRKLNLLKSIFKKRVMNNVAWNKLYKLSFLKDNKIQFKEGIIHEDELWGFEILFHANSIVLNDTITYYYNTDNDKSITKNYTLHNLECFLVVISEIFTRYYLTEKDNIRKNIVAAYIVKLKMQSIAHVYKQLTESEKNDAIEVFKKAFKNKTVVLKNHSFLRQKDKRRFKQFLHVQHMPVAFIEKYLILTRKIRFKPRKIKEILRMKKEIKRNR